MSDNLSVNRRRFLKTTATGAVAATLGANIIVPGRANAARKKLRILQWVHFVPAYDEWFNKKYVVEWGQKNDTEVTVDNIGIAGINARAAAEVSAQKGHDLFLFNWPPPSFEEQTVDMKDVFRLVAPDNVIRYEGGPLKVLLVDAGAKDNMVRSLLKRGATVVRAPWHTDLAPLAADCDGIVIGNGPGDPKDLMPLVTQVRSLLPSYRKPIFGICLGHQILALAAKGDTYKLPYGHRGVNQPVQDLITRRCYITSQNHGYAVRHEALPGDWEPWFVNVNDGTSEGIRARTRPFFSVQFHPEASPGPEDTAFLFDDFMRVVGAMARG